MLQIRDEQNEALEKDVFERELSARLHELFPDHCRALGESDVTKAIRAGVESARQYAITAPGDVARYVGILFVFGTEFDTQCDWASAVLADAAQRDGTMTIERLDAAMMAWLRDALRDSV